MAPPAPSRLTESAAKARRTEIHERVVTSRPRPAVFNAIRIDHGVLAPNARLRAMVVPHDPEQAPGKSELTAIEPGCVHGRPARISWARLLKLVFQIDLEHCPNVRIQGVAKR